VSFVIRPAAPGDLPAIRDLLVGTWHATYDRLLGREKVTEVTDRWHSLSNLAEQVKAISPSNLFLVAEQAGEILATASVSLDAEGAATLSRLYVLPRCQGLGLGAALLRASLDAFPKARLARLEVEPRNSRAIAFYKRFGFLPVSSGNSCGGNAEAAISHLLLQAPLPLMQWRPARDTDAQDLFGLITLCFAEYPGCFTDPHGDLPDLVRPGRWKERRTADGRALGGEFFVVEDASARICASIAWDMPDIDADGQPIGEIHRLYVRPDCQGRGFARRLTHEVEALARSAGARRMILWSDTRFEKAHRLYESLGYRRGATRALGDISGSIEYFFEKDL
jgi:ribosomal protein S18 acetylase RimI-like enzyme